MKLEGLAQKIIKQMKLEGRVVDVSKQGSYRLDHNLAMQFEPVKIESEHRQKVARANIADRESGRANFYKQTNPVQTYTK